MVTCTQWSKDGAARPINWQKRDWAALVLLACFCCFAFLPGLGAYGILDPSDGYYSEAAREMLESQDLITPHLNYQPFFDKPILNYWMIALSYKLFGVSELSARLPAAFCGGLMAILIYVFVRCLASRRAAFFAALILLASPMWLALGRMSLTDMPFTTFTWLALAAFFLAIKKANRYMAMLGYAALALGLLTKGPLAIVLVAINLGLYLLLTLKNKEEWLAVIKSLYVFPGLLITIVIALPWYAAVSDATRGAFSREFFFNQNFNRALGIVDHRASIFYYLPLLAGAAFPWSLLLLFQPRAWINEIRVSLKSRSGSNNHQRADLTTFGIICIIAPFLFFSALPTKLATYILPTVPATALVAGLSLDKLMRTQKSTALTWLGSLLALLALFCCICLSFPSMIASLLSTNTKISSAIYSTFLSIPVDMRSFLSLSFVLLALAGIRLAYGLDHRHLKSRLAGFIALVSISTFMSVPTMIISIQREKCYDMQSLLRLIRATNINPTMVGRRSPSATFYLHRPIHFVRDGRALVNSVKSARSLQYYLINADSYQALLTASISMHTVLQKGAWRLIAVRPKPTDRSMRDPG